VGSGTDQWRQYVALADRIAAVRKATGLADLSSLNALWEEEAQDVDRQRAINAVGSLRDAGLFEIAREMAAIEFAARPWDTWTDEALVSRVFD